MNEVPNNHLTEASKIEGDKYCEILNGGQNKQMKISVQLLTMLLLILQPT